MPVRDHFRSPLDDVTSWEGFHGGWPMVIVQKLAQKLPPRYVGAPRVHSDSQVEVDVATFDTEEGTGTPAAMSENVGGVATAVWALAQPTLAVETEPDPDEYEVRIYDAKRGRRLVAAVEIVSPGNKDRPEHRRLFVAKCAALLYAVACRWRPKGNARLWLETWYQPLALGQPLPTLPLWLTEDFAVPLELEESYQQTCRDLRIP